MRFYFEIIYKKGFKFGGHNCTKFEMKQGCLILEGFDELNYVSGYEKHEWRVVYDLNEIKEFHVQRMEEE